MCYGRRLAKKKDKTVAVERQKHLWNISGITNNV
jgi:hypothetical protein